MPTHRQNETPVVVFDPMLEISPFTLFKRLQLEGAPRLVDVRSTPGARTLAGAETQIGDDWRPDGDEQVVLFDDDGSLAVPRARELQAAGYEWVKALFGGLDLYEFSLDPEVVGSDTFLLRVEP